MSLLGRADRITIPLHVFLDLNGRKELVNGGVRRQSGLGLRVCLHGAADLVPVSESCDALGIVRVGDARCETGVTRKDRHPESFDDPSLECGYNVSMPARADLPNDPFHASPDRGSTAPSDAALHTGTNGVEKYVEGLNGDGNVVEGDLRGVAALPEGTGFVVFGVPHPSTGLLQLLVEPRESAEATTPFISRGLIGHRIGNLLARGLLGLTGDAEGAGVPKRDPACGDFLCRPARGELGADAKKQVEMVGHDRILEHIDREE
jgi:hypothetical protein